MYSSSVLLNLSGELHSLTALGRLLNSMGPIDVKKLYLYLRVLILLLRAFRCGTMHWGPVLSLQRRSFSAKEIFLCGGDLSLRRISFSVKEISFTEKEISFTNNTVICYFAL